MSKLKLAVIKHPVMSIVAAAACTAAAVLTGGTFATIDYVDAKHDGVSTELRYIKEGVDKNQGQLESIDKKIDRVIERLP